MNNLKILLITLSLSIISCQPNHNGSYLVYDAKPSFEGIWLASPISDKERNHDIEVRLRNALIGKKFDVTFSNDYITLHSLNSSTYDNIILTQKIGPDSVLLYYGEKMFDKTLFEFRLLKNETDYLILGVDCLLPADTPFYIPAQLGGVPDLKDSKQIGRVVFWLKKVN